MCQRHLPEKDGRIKLVDLQEGKISNCNNNPTRVTNPMVEQKEEYAK
jgi:hypothetical protein